MSSSVGQNHAFSCQQLVDEMSSRRIETWMEKSLGKWQ
jgi:hypothetical protein